MSWKASEIHVFKTKNFDPFHFYSEPRLVWIAVLKTTKAQLKLLAGLDMLLRGGVGREKKRLIPLFKY